MWQSSVVRPLFRNANGLAVVSGAGSPSWAPYPSIGSPTSPGHVLPCGDLSRRQKAPAALPLPSQQLSRGQRLPAHTMGSCCWCRRWHGRVGGHRHRWQWAMAWGCPGTEAPVPSPDHLCWLEGWGAGAAQRGSLCQAALCPSKAGSQACGPWEPRGSIALALVPM